MIVIDHLTKQFGRAKAVDDVSITIGAGESVALWGPNGAGKTSILRCLTGLLRYQGRITINGIDAARAGKQARACIGYVPQELGFNDDLRVGQAIEFFASLRGIRRMEVSSVLGRVQLDGQEHKRMRELSGGMKQRLALAIAMIGNPPVLVLDEVTASLDAAGRGDLVSLLAKVSRELRCSVLFASHRVEEIEALATRVVMLEKGKIVRDLPTVEFVQQVNSHLLHLTIDLPSCQRAIELLRQSGFGARMNGRGIIVPVSVGQRMTPIQLLADYRIAVRDFDLLAGGSHS